MRFRIRQRAYLHAKSQQLFIVGVSRADIGTSGRELVALFATGPKTRTTPQENSWGVGWGTRGSDWEEGHLSHSCSPAYGPWGSPWSRRTLKRLVMSEGCGGTFKQTASRLEISCELNPVCAPVRLLVAHFGSCAEAASPAHTRHHHTPDRRSRGGYRAIILQPART